MNGTPWLAPAMTMLAMTVAACGAADPGSAGDGSGDSTTASQPGALEPVAATGGVALKGICSEGSGGSCTALPQLKAVRAACAFGADCATGFCEREAGSRCGVCAPAPRAGDRCVAGECGAGLVCNGENLCVKGEPANKFCNANLPCDAGMSCAIPIMRPVSSEPAANSNPSYGAQTASLETVDSSAAVRRIGPATDRPMVPTVDVGMIAANGPQLGGICQPDVTQLGGTCDPDGLKAPKCDANSGLYCNANIDKCEQIMLAQQGESCGTIDGHLHQCALGSVCFKPWPLEQGTCARLDSPPAGCDPAQRGACGVGLRCVVPSGASAGQCEPIVSAMCM